MLVNDDHLVSERLSSVSFWKSKHINTTNIKEYIKPAKPTYLKKRRSKRLNFNYNNCNIQRFNEKAKTSKKNFRNSR